MRITMIVYARALRLGPTQEEYIKFAIALVN